MTSEAQAAKGKNKIYVPVKTPCTVFTVVLFIITEKRKQSRCLSINEWISDMYIHNEILVTKRNKVITYSTNWMNFENIMLNERS